MTRREKQLELLIYLVSSAQGLPDEPKIYGPLRLTEAAYKLCSLMLEEEKTETLQKLMERMEEDKHNALTDEQAFFQMLEDAASLLVECV